MYTVSERIRLEELEKRTKEILDKMHDISSKLDDLHEKLESQDTLYYGLLHSILAEFNDHRQAFYLILEDRGIPCDDLKGWNINNEVEINGRNNKQSKTDVNKRKQKQNRKWFTKGKQNEQHRTRI